MGRRRLGFIKAARKVNGELERIKPRPVTREYGQEITMSERKWALWQVWWQRHKAKK